MEEPKKKTPEKQKQEDPLPVPTPVRKSRAPKNTDINKILKQRRKNPLMTISDQARLNGIDKSALSRLLKRHGIDANHVEDYKESRADVFAGKQELVLHHINGSAIKRIVEKHPMAAVSLFGVLYDKERLERGQSTSNQSVFFQIVQESDQAD